MFCAEARPSTRHRAPEPQLVQLRFANETPLRDVVGPRSLAKFADQLFVTLLDHYRDLVLQCHHRGTEVTSRVAAPSAIDETVDAMPKYVDVEMN